MSDAFVLLAVVILLQVAALVLLGAILLHLDARSRAAAIAEGPDVWPEPAPEPTPHLEHVWPAEPFGSSENGQMQNYRCTVCGAVTSKAGAA